jgi:alpha,alpha-trehalase
MAGTLDLVQRCYGGVQIQRDRVVIRPWLPERIRGVHFPVYYRSHRLDVRITPDRVRIKMGKDGPAPIRVRIGDETFELGPGAEVDRSLASAVAG